MALHYLTLQDVLWINLQVTGGPQDFRFDDLEEATFYQYGYGGSQSIVPQAARFLKGFLKKKPFDAGNEATAFVACLGFLKVNGLDYKGTDSLAWFTEVENGTREPEEAIEKSFSEASDRHHLDVQESLEAVAADEKETIAHLMKVPV